MATPTNNNTIPPLDWRSSIVDTGGRPTPAFQRAWNSQRSINSVAVTVTLGSGVPEIVPTADGSEYVDISTTPFTLYVGSNGSFHQTGVKIFTDLADVPHSYAGSSDLLLRVNSAGTGLEFIGISSVLDGIGSTEGDILYRSGSSWVALAPGSSGQVLTTAGAGAPPVWAAGGGGGGGGGGGTPTLRATSHGNYDGASVNATLPTGTVAGDVVLAYWENGFEINATPTGWAPIWVSANSSNFTNQACVGKVMTADDISTGFVTLVSIGSFFGVWFLAAFEGSTVTVYEGMSHFDSSGSASFSSIFISGVPGASQTAYLLGFASSRGATGSITVSSGLTILDDENSASNACGISFFANGTSPPNLFGLSESLTSIPAGNNGIAWIIIAIT